MTAVCAPPTDGVQPNSQPLSYLHKICRQAVRRIYVLVCWRKDDESSIFWLAAWEFTMRDSVIVGHFQGCINIFMWGDITLDVTQSHTSIITTPKSWYTGSSSFMYQKQPAVASILDSKDSSLQEVDFDICPRVKKFDLPGHIGGSVSNIVHIGECALAGNAYDLNHPKQYTFYDLSSQDITLC